jgi:hypothetical protein|tara:strand:- start:496 stop:834 length:339 start_codon:yes stop_codon:yes gene_type:complete
MEDMLKGAREIEAKVKALRLEPLEQCEDKASSQSVRQQLMTTFERIGGERAFAEFVKKDDRNKREFYGWWSKLAPKEDGVVGTQIQINVINYNGENNNTVQLPAAQIPDTTL